MSAQTVTTSSVALEIIQITADGCENNEGIVWSTSDLGAFPYYNSTNVINVNNTYECLEYKAKCYNRYCPQYPPNWSDPLSASNFRHTQSNPGYSPTFSNYLNNNANRSIGKPEYAYRRQLSCLQQKSSEEYARTGENGWGGGFTKHLFDRFAKENTCDFSANRPCRFDCQTGCILDIGFEKHSRELIGGFASYIPSVSLLNGSIANWTIQHEAFLSNAVSTCFNELNNDPNYHKCFIDTETLKSIVQGNARLLRIFMQFLANPTPIGQMIVNFQLIQRSMTQAISDSDLNQAYNHLPNPLTQAQLFSQQALNSSQLKVTAGNNFFIQTNSSVQLTIQPSPSSTTTYQLSVDPSIATVDANGLLTVHSTTEPLINGRLPFYVIATSNGQTGIGQFAIYDTDNDKDMISDTYEQRIGLNPMIKNDLKSDLDGDDLLDVFEVCLGSNPLKQDTDGDSFSDLEEYLKGTIPNLASSYPNPPQISSVSSGDWHATTTWSCNCIPTKFEEVTVNSGHAVTLSLQNAEAQRLLYNGGSVIMAIPNSKIHIGSQK